MLAGEPGAKITVSFVWNAGPGDRQVVPIAGLSASYSKFPLKFTAGGDSTDGRIEISGTGEGSFHIGAVPLMPADNIRGFRPDTIGLLKQQRSGMWRSVRSQTHGPLNRIMRSDMLEPLPIR